MGFVVTPVATPADQREALICSVGASGGAADKTSWRTIW